jgi:hypothetical protein
MVSKILLKVLGSGVQNAAWTTVIFLESNIFLETTFQPERIEFQQMLLEMKKYFVQNRFCAKSCCITI